MRITKEEFTKAINTLQAQINYDEEWAKKVGEVFPAAFDANLLYNNREITEGLISLLESLTGDGNTKWIDYFMYECDFGNKELECHYEDGTPFILKTPDDVYDLLERNIEVKKSEPSKLPMYVGNFDMGSEIIKALEDAGGINERHLYTGMDEDVLYLIRESDNCIIRFPKNMQWIMKEIYELKELSPINNQQQ